jgi:hypothetical protein
MVVTPARALVYLSSEIKDPTQRLEFQRLMKAGKWKAGVKLFNQVSRNRNIREDAVQQIARSITNGHWRPRVSTIHFMADKSLGNGNHRCFACIVAGKAIETVVVYGCTELDLKMLDKDSAPRKTFDTLRMEGASNCKALASGSRMVWMTLNEGLRPSAQEIYETYQAHQADLEWAVQTFTKKNLKVASVQAAFALARALYPVEVEQLARLLVDTIGRTEGCLAIPIETMLANNPDAIRHGSDLSVVRKVLRAIQAHVEHLSLAKLQDTDEGVRWLLERRAAQAPKHLKLVA